MSGLPILLGVFGAAHGVRGELRLKSYTADPMAIARYGPLTAEDGRVFELRAARPYKADMLIVSVKGVDDRDAAERLVNLELHAPRQALGSTGEDEFFHADLIGLTAVAEDGASIGRVVALHDFGAGDILEVAPGGGGATRYYPFTKAVVPRIDLGAGRLVLVPPAESIARGEDHD
jgi:16S rRNA processing protein RimM